MNDSVATTRGVDPRFQASAVPSITGLRLSPGGAVDLVNISCSGMLVEGNMRFAPGTRVTATFEGSFEPEQIDGAVVRCQVSSISGGTVRYQFAIQFDQRLDEHAIELDPHAARHGNDSGPSRPDEPVAAASPRPAVNRW